MAINNFIPAVWAAQALMNLRKTLVYGQLGVINRDYEGDIANEGDTVRITSIGPVTVGTYSKNTNISDPETLTDAATSLVVDQSKYFNFAIDDIDKAQQKPKVMASAMQQASYALSDTTDQFIAGLMKDAVPTTNTLGTEASPKSDLGTAGNAYQYLVDLGVLLDEANVPSGGRWAIVPPWFHGLLQKDDRFVKAGTPATDQVLRNGVIGEAAGFMLMKSMNVPYTTTTTGFKILAGTSIATTYAEQIASIEAYRPEKRFGDAVKGLHLYGAKVIRPESLAMLIANRP